MPQAPISPFSSSSSSSSSSSTTTTTTSSSSEASPPSEAALHSIAHHTGREVRDALVAASIGVLAVCLVSANAVARAALHSEVLGVRYDAERRPSDSPFYCTGLNKHEGYDILVAVFAIWFWYEVYCFTARCPAQPFFIHRLKYTVVCGAFAFGTLTLLVSYLRGGNLGQHAGWFGFVAYFFTDLCWCRFYHKVMSVPALLLDALSTPFVIWLTFWIIIGYVLLTSLALSMVAQVFLIGLAYPVLMAGLRMLVLKVWIRNLSSGKAVIAAQTAQQEEEAAEDVGSDLDLPQDALTETESDEAAGEMFRLMSLGLNCSNFAALILKPKDISTFVTSVALSFLCECSATLLAVGWNTSKRLNEKKVKVLTLKSDIRMEHEMELSRRKKLRFFAVKSANEDFGEWLALISVCLFVLISGVLLEADGPGSSTAYAARCAILIGVEFTCGVFKRAVCERRGVLIANVTISPTWPQCGQLICFSVAAAWMLSIAMIDLPCYSFSRETLHAVIVD